MRSTAFSFAAEVEGEIEALPTDEFHRRQGRAKVLLEEWYPISRLAVHLKQPGLEVEVEAFGGSGAADGRIEERGFRQRVFDVQVTFVDDYEGSMRRELLRKQGFTPGAGPISREKSTGNIQASIAAVDSDHNLKQAASGIAKRFAMKEAKTYAPTTVLLIAFEDMTLLGHATWVTLLSLVKAEANLAQTKFAGVYIINCATNEIAKAA